MCGCVDVGVGVVVWMCGCVDVGVGVGVGGCIKYERLCVCSFKYLCAFHRHHIKNRPIYDLYCLPCLSILLVVATKILLEKQAMCT